MSTIKRIKEKLNNYYAEKAERADKIKSDRVAIHRLTSLENAQIADEKTIDNFVAICEKLNINFDVQL